MGRKEAPAPFRLQKEQQFEMNNQSPWELPQGSPVHRASSLGAAKMLERRRLPCFGSSPRWKHHLSARGSYLPASAFLMRHAEPRFLRTKSLSEKTNRAGGIAQPCRARADAIPAALLFGDWKGLRGPAPQQGGCHPALDPLAPGRPGDGRCQERLRPRCTRAPAPSARGRPGSPSAQPPAPSSWGQKGAQTPWGQGALTEGDTGSEVTPSRWPLTPFRSAGSTAPSCKHRRPGPAVPPACWAGEQTCPGAVAPRGPRQQPARTTAAARRGGCF